MSRRSKKLLLVFVALLAAIPLTARSQDAPPPVRVLVVDETKTFASTMRVAGLVGGLRQTQLFEVDVRLADVESSWDDPLAGEVIAEGDPSYDVLVIVPRGIDDGSVRWIWIVSAWIDELEPHVRVGLEAVSQVVDAVFVGVGEAFDGTEDLWPCLLWVAYSARGWIR